MVGKLRALSGDADGTALDQRFQQRLGEERVPAHPLENKRQHRGADLFGAQTLAHERRGVLG